MTSIDKYAFQGCTGLESVTSLIKEPFDINENVFQLWDSEARIGYFTSATLYVPKGTKEKYEATPAWNQFKKIEEIEVSEQPKGDVNGDQAVNVADIASVIDAMAAGTNDTAADVNGDGVVDVADIATIIDVMAARARQQEIED